MKFLRPIFLSVFACLFSPLAAAATITVINTNGPGEGFNDPTVVPALPSNPFTTLGAQRLHVLQTAANQWGTRLLSAIEIRVQVSFDALSCSGTTAVLGSAGALTVHANFANAPVANVWYNSALASSLAGSDLNGGSNDIDAQFNVAIDNGTCLDGTAGWYYATLASDAAPTGRIPLMPVVLHELAHGLGFQTFTDSDSGAFSGGTPSIWDTFLADAVTGTTWINMASNAARRASAISDPNLIWKGPNVTADKTNFVSLAPALVVTAPAAITGEKTVSTAIFGPAVTPPGISGEVLAATDASGVSLLDGCEPLTSNVSGKIALLLRGNCNFTVKVKNAQDAGAIAAIIDNNVATGMPGMGGEDASVTIASYGISQADGNALRAQLAIPTIVNATLGFGAQLAGTQISGGTSYVRMYAPNPEEPGSSVSHWSVDAFPNLLMEPAISSNLFSDTDLTLALFKDIGWRVNAPTSIGLQSGVAQSFSIPAGAYTSSFYVDVSESDQTLRIDLDSTTATADVDLYLRYGTPFPDTFGDGRALTPNYINELGQYRSISSTNDEWLVVSKSSVQPLRAGRWYLLAINYGTVDAASSLLATRLQTVAPAAAFSVNFNATGSADSPCSTTEWNDPAIVSASGGNPGTTRGAQRRNAMLRAAELLATQLQSPVPVIIDACWDNLGTGNSITLAQAGPRFAFRDDDLPDVFPGGESPNEFAFLAQKYTWYAGTPAARLAGTSLCRMGFLSCATADLRATFNNQVDSAAALGSRSFYYGFNAPPAGNQDVDFLTVAMHEITHGLGFVSFVDIDGSDGPAGSEFNGYDDIYSANVTWIDNGAVRPFNLLSDAGRVQAITSNINLRWSGVSAITSSFNPSNSLPVPDSLPRLYAPLTVEGGSTLSHFEPSHHPQEMMKPSITGPQRDMRLGRAILDGIGWSNLASPLPPDPRPPGGFYYDPQHTGHGIEFSPATADSDVYILLFYSYDSGNNPEWFLAAGRFVDGSFVPEPDRFGHSLQRYTYDNNRTPRAQIDPGFDGQVRLDFVQAKNAPACANAQAFDGALAVMTFTLGGDRNQQWCMQELVPRSIRPSNDRTGTWYAGSQDSGWGTSLGSIPGASADNGGLFGILYYYDGQGKPRWAISATGDLQSGATLPLLSRSGYCRSCAIPPSFPEGRDTTIGSIGYALALAGSPGSTLSYSASWPGPEAGNFARTNSPLLLLSIPVADQHPR
ncbi:MAG: hypothetical protein COS34_04670 [Lysobacterales bacterium CG02_land_8_20_14_3_00_62_12]|nr:MAG: hypothetical protein COS34_04670 [Xanthomonadales bacterium CG02_land_8_20_14_3_00_62_12]